MNDEKKFSNFILLWVTQSLSRLGSSLTPFALILWAYDRTGSALSIALLTVSSYVPYILLSLSSRHIFHCKKIIPAVAARLTASQSSA